MMDLVRLWTMRARQTALLSALILPAICCVAPTAALAEPKDPVEAQSDELPARVTAVYRIKFGLLGDIGWFKFTSKLEGGDYKLTAQAKVDTAVFDYVGKMSSNGEVESSATKPADYRFHYKQQAAFGKKKDRSLAMVFDRTGVKKIRFMPPDPPSKKAIPVTEDDLKGALDPLSGVMALSLGDLSDPCSRKLPIFDGKQRFDLVFNSAKSGPRGAPQVCNVRLLPISGHKKGKGADSVISGKIEVELAPVHKANIVVPKKVTVPTIIGAAELTTERIEIIMPNKQRFALKQ